MPARVANAFKDAFGVTKKFVDFVITFRPPEPESSQWTQRPVASIDWSEASLKKILKIVYKYRSKALHEGRPFPVPMCEPAHTGDDCASAEKPRGHMSMGGGVWRDEDLPLLLQTFEYITRMTILNWWRAGAPREHVGRGNELSP